MSTVNKFRREDRQTEQRYKLPTNCSVHSIPFMAHAFYKLSVLVAIIHGPLLAMGLSIPTMKSRQMQASFDRRYLVQKLTWTSILWSQTIEKASAKVIIKPDAAFRSLVKSREELEYASKNFLINKDYDGMRDYLSDSSLSMNNYEDNATALLTSKQLDAESKVAIGTIRRYGVGADVIISYGGLRAELDTNESPNYGSVSKSLQRTMYSLDEVIAICRSNGFEVK